MATKSTKYTLSENGTVLYRWREIPMSVIRRDGGQQTVLVTVDAATESDALQAAVLECERRGYLSATPFLAGHRRAHSTGENIEASNAAADALGGEADGGWSAQPEKSRKRRNTPWS